MRAVRMAARLAVSALPLAALLALAGHEGRAADVVPPARTGSTARAEAAPARRPHPDRPAAVAGVAIAAALATPVALRGAYRRTRRPTPAVEWLRDAAVG